jgi:hypothetical protein
LWLKLVNLRQLFVATQVDVNSGAIAEEIQRGV